MEKTRTDPIALDPRPAKAAAREGAAVPGRKGELQVEEYKDSASLRGRNRSNRERGGSWPIPRMDLSSGIILGEKKEVIPASAAIGPMLKISPLIINLKDEGGRHYIKTTIILEIGQPEWLEEVRSRVPLLTDLAILTLGDKQLKELRNAEAKENLKKELLIKINQALGSPKVAQIYFDEFLFQ